MTDAHWANWGCGTLLAAELKPSPNAARVGLPEPRAHRSAQTAGLRLGHVHACLQDLHACLCGF